MTSYDYRNNCLTLTCNKCGKEAEFNGDYRFCIDLAKGEGLIIVKRKSGFHHYCCDECSGMHGMKVSEFVKKLSNKEQDDFFKSISKAGGLIK